MECIREIVQGVKVGCFFDTHYVINRAIKDYSDDYLRFVSQFANSEQPTFTAHQQIGQQVAKYEKKLVERQASQSHSLNIHGNGSECALWKRISGSGL
jgi:hypothetical protein